MAIDDQVQKAINNLVEHNIVIPHPEEITDYLSKHQDMVNLVERLCAKATQHFHGAVEVSLERSCDPESEENYSFLVLYARRDKYTPEFMAELDKLCNRYCQQFRDELSRISGEILITTDFSPPLSSARRH